MVLYTRPSCHLCETAREVVETVAAHTGTAWREVDISAGPRAEALTAKYGEYVPVVEVDGVQQGFWRIDQARLARLLA
ncbi:glutaredoxin family protein [Myceligenerans sp. I2]|uniref:Glutaredoxin family protein n=1 Tax=Myceligenerans indicum TaxID=2593663 RepID=A0ABS1LMQ4_9MICO|nr:glutaredoxin family protein [Myceligenerans indicum]